MLIFNQVTLVLIQRVMGPMRRLMTELQPHFHRQSSTLFFSLCGKMAAHSTCYLSAFQMNKALAFTGNNNQRANVVAGDERVVNSLSIYLTPWGQVSFQPSRENRSGDVFIMQDDMWEVPVLRGTKNVALPKLAITHKDKWSPS